MKKHKFGSCPVCEAPVKIPGLDGYLCSAECGWVKNTEIKLLLRRQKKAQKEVRSQESEVATGCAFASQSVKALVPKRTMYRRLLLTSDFCLLTSFLDSS